MSRKQEDETTAAQLAKETSIAERTLAVDPNGAENTIMVIDDTPANLKLLQAQLLRADYRVVVFTSGAVALEAAKREPPGVILLDISMPGMDGLEVCRRLKADAALESIPVLFISAYNQTEDKVRAFDAGGVDYISKPFQVEEVLARVRAHLTIRRQERLLEETLATLRDLERQRDTLVHMVAHDLRSPLMVLTVTLRLLRVDRSLADRRRVVERGLTATRRMEGLLDTMLTVSKLETGRLQLDLRKTDLRELLRRSVDEINVLAADRSVALDIPSAPVTVECDAEQVSRVLQNLLSNAVAHTDPKTGTVAVRAVQTRDAALVEVADNGPGVAEKDREIIFDKFARGELQSNSHGLGLAFSRLAVQAHGGSIGVTPGAHGGSVFWFTLPIDGRAPT